MTKKARRTYSDRQIATQASSVFDHLQRDILTGQLQPGLKLRLNVLINEYGTGNSPLREALNRLSANGMVVREENRGFCVAPASIEDLMELTKTRCWLDEIGIRESIANGDTEWEEGVVLAFHRLTRAARSKEENEYPASDRDRYHREFHLALTSACGSSILTDFCTVLYQRTTRYQNLAGVAEYQGRHELEEHRELQEAVLQRNADLAVKLLHSHYEMTSDILFANGKFK